MFSQYFFGPEFISKWETKDKMKICALLSLRQTFQMGVRQANLDFRQVSFGLQYFQVRKIHLIPQTLAQQIRMYGLQPPLTGCLLLPHSPLLFARPHLLLSSGWPPVILFVKESSQQVFVLCLNMPGTGLLWVWSTGAAGWVILMSAGETIALAVNILGWPKSAFGF